MAREFLENNACGSCVILTAPRLPDILKAQADTELAGIPGALFTDSGHVLPPHFNGGEIVTAFAAGPVHPEAARRIFRRFRCVR
jgi:hypothetical protein